MRKNIKVDKLLQKLRASIVKQECAYCYKHTKKYLTLTNTKGKQTHFCCAECLYHDLTEYIAEKERIK